MDCRLGLESDGTPKFKCCPFTIFATTGISIFEKSLWESEAISKAREGEKASKVGGEKRFVYLKAKATTEEDLHLHSFKSLNTNSK